MKTAIQTAYGRPEVVVIRDMPMPEPKANEILVKVMATTVTSGDARMRAFRIPTAFWLPARLFMGITKPRRPVLGCEFAGVIESVGAEVTRLKAGDKVFGMHVMDTHAEYKVVPQTAAILPLPASLDFAGAAALPFGALTALFFLRQAGIVAGRQVLINGASGAVGAYAIQIARQLGAEVTAVCSAGNAELALSLGAARAIDYRTADFSTSGQRYDVIMDTVDTVSVAQFERATGADGILLAVNAGGGMFARAAWRKLTGGRRIVTGVATETLVDLEAVRGMVEAGQLQPVIDSTVPFDEIVRAHARVDSGRKRGAVVVSLG
jgi:NADPH:quinone reductase-like Zn-dependent oxidoreductase